MRHPRLTTGAQRSADSSHASVVQSRPSLQSRAVPVQLPAPLHASITVQYCPSLHAVPLGAGDQDDVDTELSHTRQGFIGSGVPFAMHAPPIRQPELTTDTHRSAASSQMSLVHDRPSLHARAVPVHVPAPLHASITVQYCASSHVVPPGAGVHAVRVAVGSQARHAFAGFAEPVARQMPEIRQPVAIVLSHRLADSSHVSVVHERPSEQSRGLPVHELDPLHASDTVQYWPSLHVVPEGSGGLLHTPPLHTSCVQATPSEHELQSAPPVPQALTDVPGWHADPSQQPEHRVASNRLVTVATSGPQT
jgi:hypothetical protein